MREIAIVDADVAEFGLTALPQERQKRLVLGISVEHWEHVVISDYQNTWGLGAVSRQSIPYLIRHNKVSR